MSKRRLAFGLAALGGALAVSLGGSWSGTEATARTAAPEDVALLVQEFSGGSSLQVVRRLEEVTAGSPDDGRALTLLGLGYQQLARETGDTSWLARAGDALERATRPGVGDSLTLAARAQLAASRHRFRDAIPLARRALALDSENVLALGVLGDALVETGRYAEGFTTYDRLAALGPSVGAYARVANARSLLGRSGAALDAMELAVEAGSSIPEQEAWALTRYGVLLFEAGRLDDAVAAFRRALGLAPGYVQAEAGLAHVDAVRGRYGEAARKLRDIVRRQAVPEYAELLGDVFALDGKEREAERAYERVRKLEGVHATNGVRTELHTALFDLDQGVRLEDALRRARRAYGEAPSIVAADAVAWGLVRTGRCEEARDWSDRSLRLGTGDAHFLFHRAMLERCLGRHAEAGKLFRQVLDSEPYFSLTWRDLALKLAS